MIHRPGQIAKRELEHLTRLERTGAGGRHRRCANPTSPGRAVEDRFDEDRTNIEVTGVRVMRQAHGVGEGIVPGTLVVDGVALRISGR